MADHLLCTGQLSKFDGAIWQAIRRNRYTDEMTRGIEEVSTSFLAWMWD